MFVFILFFFTLMNCQLHNYSYFMLDVFCVYLLLQLNLLYKTHTHTHTKMTFGRSLQYCAWVPDGFRLNFGSRWNLLEAAGIVHDVILSRVDTDRADVVPVLVQKVDNGSLIDEVICHVSKHHDHTGNGTT